ncbi:phosphoribosyl-AMP cyclohydrolase [Patescibacteria group bacterium]|nr:phosphoribosyl-AMP cyclohydrolase [Patescibacteria group bacterium]
MKLLDELKFNSQGLIPAIIQDLRTGEVLMMAWMNREAVEKTLCTGRTYFWSRSRRKLWMKGEKSGHYQLVKEIRVDCDGDSLLVKVNQIKAACHTGYKSCFFKKVTEKGDLKIVGKKIFNPEKIYK